MDATNNWRNLFFPATIKEYCDQWYPSQVLHVLCLRGSMSFVYQDTLYNIARGDLVILTDMAHASTFQQSGDFEAVIMCVVETWTASLSLRNSYGVVGGLALMFNPVLKMNDADFHRIHRDMLRLKEHLDSERHPFWEDMIGCLVMAHILDLYNISYKMTGQDLLSGRNAEILREFFTLLYSGAYVEHRDLKYYADRLCITPHHLSDVCKDVSGKPATYWIDNFTIQEIAHLLRDEDLPLTEIAYRMNFSSLSYFSRYVTKQLGMSPTQFRNR